MLTSLPILQSGDFTQMTSKDSAVDHVTTAWLAKPCNSKKCYRQIHTFLLMSWCHNAMKFSRKENRARWERFSTFRRRIDSLKRRENFISWWGFLTKKIFSDREPRKMWTFFGVSETDRFPETTGKLHILTGLSAQKNFIELCRRQSFNTDMVLKLLRVE
jgi:hypothetical protein